MKYNYLFAQLHTVGGETESNGGGTAENTSYASETETESEEEGELEDFDEESDEESDDDDDDLQP